MQSLSKPSESYSPKTVSVITGSDVLTYTRCPKRAWFAFNQPEVQSLSLEARIIIFVIKKMYTFRLEKERDATWKHLISWFDYASLKFLKDCQPQERYKENKNLLTRLNKWYTEYYCKEFTGVGYSDLPVSFRVSDSIIFQDTIDLVEIHSGEVSIIDFIDSPSSSKEISNFDLYNDLRAHIKLWAFCKASEMQPKKYTRFVITPYGIKALTISVTDKALSKANKMVLYSIVGMGNDVFYPSVSEQCTKCPFRTECNF